MTQQRGFDGHRVRPAHVMRAILANDTRTLNKLSLRSVATRKKHAHEKKVAKFNEWLDASRLAIEHTHNLADLRDLYKETRRYLKRRRKSLTDEMQKQVVNLHTCFRDRAEELKQAKQAEFEFRARETNEHICPVD